MSGGGAYCMFCIKIVEAQAHKSNWHDFESAQRISTRRFQAKYNNNH